MGAAMDARHLRIPTPWYTIRTHHGRARTHLTTGGYHKIHLTTVDSGPRSTPVHDRIPIPTYRNQTPPLCFLNAYGF